MGMFVIVALHFLLQHVKSRDNHTSCTRFCLYHLAGAKEEVLEHTELILVEGIVICVCVGILRRPEIQTWQISNVTDSTTVMAIIVFQLLTCIIVFCQQSLLDNHVHLVSFDVDGGTEAVTKLG